MKLIWGRQNEGCVFPRLRLVSGGGITCHPRAAQGPHSEPCCSLVAGMGAGFLARAAKPRPYEPLRPTWPLRSSIHLTEVQAAEPLDVTVSLPYQDFQDDHKVKAAPWGPKVMVRKMRFIGCFQQLHWLWGRKGRLYPSGNV